MLRLVLAFAVLLAPAAAIAQPPATASAAQRMGDVPTEAVRVTARAQNGEQVFILFNSVNPEKKAQFEDFIDKFSRVMAQVVEKDPVLKANAGTTRILYPAAPARDGRLVYVFLIDPVVPGVDYDMDALMRRVLSREETNALMQQYLTSLDLKERPAECGNHDNLALVQRY